MWILFHPPKLQWFSYFQLYLFLTFYNCFSSPSPFFLLISTHITSMALAFKYQYTIRFLFIVSIHKLLALVEGYDVLLVFQERLESELITGKILKMCTQEHPLHLCLKRRNNPLLWLKEIGEWGFPSIGLDCSSLVCVGGITLNASEHTPSPHISEWLQFAPGTLFQR